MKTSEKVTFISNWIKNYCLENEISITNEACAILAEHLGIDLTALKW